MKNDKYIEVFAGAGGLSLALELAGFKAYKLYEKDARCAETLRANLGHAAVVHEDVRAVDFMPFRDQVAVLAGGVPCQPWSTGGKHQGYEDPRNLWPDFLRAVREIHPEVVIAENVAGITRPGFRAYFDYIVSQLAFPYVERQPDEPWESHAAWLGFQSPRAHLDAFRYDVEVLEVDAADYSVPQHRKRTFIIAIRDDVPHGRVSDFLVKGVFRRTLRSAIADLPDPDSPEAAAVPDHVPVRATKPRPYPGHTPNELDAPAKTVKAGVHGCPGGEFILRLDDGSLRNLTLREIARIQTFPDDWEFAGPRTEKLRQLGNAVPPTLGFYVARAVRKAVAASQECGAL